MKKFVLYKKKRWMALLAMVLTFASCNNKELADAVYPEPTIYMPAAVNGIFEISSISTNIGNVPTQGHPSRYRIDLEGGKFIIPLAVYTGGVDNGGRFKVDIAVNTDTVMALMDMGSLVNVTLLPADQYSMVSSVEIGDGPESVPFDLDIDLDFLRSNPDKRFAIGVQISSTQRTANPKLSSTIIVVDTKIMNPTADFSYQVDGDNWAKINFDNASLNAEGFSWDFGDGSDASSETAPAHEYDSPGIYEVTLTATGITGDKITKTGHITVAQRVDKSTWKISGYDSEEPAEGAPNGLASAAIDGDVNTYWHSEWAQNQPNYPHWFSVDMGKTVTITSFEVFRRQGDNRGQTKHQFFVSTDGIQWTDAGVFEMDPQMDNGQTFPVAVPIPARYFKYVALEGTNYFAFLAEINAYGF